MENDPKSLKNTILDVYTSWRQTISLVIKFKKLTFQIFVIPHNSSSFTTKYSPFSSKVEWVHPYKQANYKYLDMLFNHLINGCSEINKILSAEELKGMSSQQMALGNKAARRPSWWTPHIKQHEELMEDLGWIFHWDGATNGFWGLGGSGEWLKSAGRRIHFLYSHVTKKKKKINRLCGPCLLASSPIMNCTID